MQSEAFLGWQSCLTLLNSIVAAQLQMRQSPVDMSVKLRRESIQSVANNSSVLLEHGSAKLDGNNLRCVFDPHPIAAIKLTSHVTEKR